MSGQHRAAELVLTPVMGKQSDFIITLNLVVAAGNCSGAGQVEGIECFVTPTQYIAIQGTTVKQHSDHAVVLYPSDKPLARCGIPFKDDVQHESVCNCGTIFGVRELPRSTEPLNVGSAP